MNFLLKRNSFTNNFRNCLFQRIIFFNSSSANKTMFVYNYHNVTSNSYILKLPGNNCKRFCSGDSSGPPTKKMATLMNFPEIVWPSFFKSIRNFIFATLIIKPYFDREFTLSEFVRGSKQAVEIVSSKLAEGDYTSLKGLVTNDVLTNLQKSISTMSLAQREELSIKSDDIYFSFPYQIGIIFSDDSNNRRFVEITMVYHALRGLSVMKARGEEPPLNMGMLPEYRTRILICNYRFVREFTKGVEEEWTINLLNHFKPTDLIDE
ncbi:m-AAA protease-interacting protein 1, mitochondrial [Agrilus planipennis]|uniref:M-AAA protease-interacting protein 1, mitochondrial n=1 Tax=Agrilus planipennis TaxID=224129 RepID=A0A1W4XLF6_AGRPL|nr:m-AAA protease-interacting protein 1, mitochondrial [Agrilus planipennis]